MNEIPTAVEAEDLSEARLQAVATVARLLRHFVNAGSPQTLKEASIACGLSSSTAHRYLQSLAEENLLSQARKSGKYDLGPFALSLGLAALSRIDVVNVAMDEMEQLADSTGCSVRLAVWSQYGPVNVKAVRGRHLVNVMSTAGDRLPVWGSTAGRVFLSFLPRNITASLLEEELSHLTEPPALAAIEACIAEVRRTGIAISRSDSTFQRVVFLSVPIFDADRSLRAVISLFSPREQSAAQHRQFLLQAQAFCRRVSLSVPELPFEEPAF